MHEQLLKGRAWEFVFQIVSTVFCGPLIRLRLQEEEVQEEQEQEHEQEQEGEGKKYKHR